MSYSVILQRAKSQRVRSVFDEKNKILIVSRVVWLSHGRYTYLIVRERGEG